MKKVLLVIALAPAVVIARLLLSRQMFELFVKQLAKAAEQVA